MNRRELRVADGDTVSFSPEAQLRWLFRRKAELQREISAIDGDIAQERCRYAAKHGLLMLPGIETLRRVTR